MIRALEDGDSEALEKKSVWNGRRYVENPRRYLAAVKESSRQGTPETDLG